MTDRIAEKYLNSIPYYPRPILNRHPPSEVSDSDVSTEELAATVAQKAYRPPQPQFLEPIHHNDRPDIMTGIRAKLIVNAVMFDGVNTTHHLIEEPDRSMRMHSITFADKSELYFETEPGGHIVNLKSDCLLELRDGVLVASAMSVLKANGEAKSEDEE